MSNDITQVPNIDIGSRHILTSVMNKIKKYFTLRGFKNESHIAPLMDTTEYNFTKLNMPENHPARDHHQSFFLNNGLILRTHTSNGESRIIQKYNQYSVFSMGPVFRRDDDSTHTSMFHQVEVMKSSSTISDMIYEIRNFLHYMFGEEKQIRLRTNHFCFTEPSYEVDVKFGDKWLEILGCGITHHKVFSHSNRSYKHSYAIGFGVERITSIMYNITDIRELYSADISIIQKWSDNVRTS